MINSDTYIKAYTWHGLKRYTAMVSGNAVGPARTTILVAVSDAHIKGGKVDGVYDCDTGEYSKLMEYKEQRS